MATRATGNILGGSATAFRLDELIELHRGFIKRGEGRRLGRLVKIVLAELPKGVTLGISDAERLQEGRTLDWFNRGPLLALSPGDIDVLVTSQVEPLPKKPQPGYKPETKTQQQIEAEIRATGKFTPPQAPLVEQRPEDRGCTRIKGTTMLCFEPVHEILYRPSVVQTWGSILATTDQATGTHMAFVWDIRMGEGFFYGGRFQVRE
jgi:hypothetical protein